MYELRQKLELRLELKNLLTHHLFLSHLLPTQRQRDEHLASSIKVTELINQTNCPFSIRELEAFKHGNVYSKEIIAQANAKPKNRFAMPSEPIVKIPNITVHVAQMIEEWFEGYEVLR